jgi:hypothetical protein
MSDRDELYQFARAIGQASLPSCPGSERWAPGDPDHLGHGICEQCGRSIPCNSSGIVFSHKAVS